MRNIFASKTKSAQVTDQPFPSLWGVDRLLPIAQTIPNARIDQNEVSSGNDEWTGQAHLDAITSVGRFLFFPQFSGYDTKLGTTVVPPETIVEKMNRQIPCRQHA